MGTLKYAYYPGCASQEMTREANDTTRLVAAALGIELVDMPKANCCGAGLMYDYDYDLAITLNARIFAEAESMGLDIMTICSTCLMVMRTANRDLRRDASLLARTNEALAKAGLRYSGKVEIKQLLWVLAQDYGLGNLRRRVIKPLNWLRVAPFYGCHTLRPSDALGMDDPENPRSLEDVIQALGAEVVNYRDKTRCCGFQVDLVAEDMAVEMTGKRLLGAKGRGAHCMVTPCPFCHINLDNYQGLAEKKINKTIGLPVFHLPQLVGMALGLGPDQMGLDRHLVSMEGIYR